MINEGKNCNDFNVNSNLSNIEKNECIENDIINVDLTEIDDNLNNVNDNSNLNSNDNVLRKSTRKTKQADYFQD